MPKGTHDFFKIEPISNPVKNVAEINLLEKSMAQLPQPTAKDLIPGKIIILKAGQTKIGHRCPKSRILTVIDFNETSGNFRLFNNNVMEFECDCGTIFRKGL